MKLSEKPITSAMLSTIHVLKQRAGMDDDTYRDFLDREASVRTAKDLTIITGGRVIDRLKEAAGQGVGPRGAVAGLDTNIGRKLRALWIAGYDLGIVRDRTDKAMLAYLQRQTGVSHTNFLREPRAGNSAIEGLKAWLAREAKVEWPADTADVKGAKLAVVRAQWRRCIDIGAIRPFTEAAWDHGLDHYACKVVRKYGSIQYFEPEDYDELQKALGRKLRAWIINHGAGK